MWFPLSIYSVAVIRHFRHQRAAPDLPHHVADIPDTARELIHPLTKDSKRDGQRIKPTRVTDTKGLVTPLKCLVCFSDGKQHGKRMHKW